MNSFVLFVFIVVVPEIWCQHFHSIDINFSKNGETFTLNRADQINHETEVTDVWIENQNVTHLKKGTFSNLLQLKTIKIQECKVTEIEKQAFLNVPSLRVLNLNQNKLNTIKGGIFEGLMISKLYLSMNAIESLEEDAFHDLKYLEVLDLSRNKLKELKPYMFNGTTFLRQLNLAFNNLIDIPDKCFLYGFVNTVSGQDTYIDLDDNQLTQFNSKSFDGVYIIKKLSINNNKLEELKPNFMQDIQYIEEVYLENNNLRNLNYTILKKLQTANIINLYGNSWSCSFVSKFSNWCDKYQKDKMLDYSLLEDCNVV